MGRGAILVHSPAIVSLPTCRRHPIFCHRCQSAPFPAAADPLSQQALDVQAQDLALEDSLYALDKSLNTSSIEPDAYLKQVCVMGAVSGIVGVWRRWVGCGG